MTADPSDKETDMTTQNLKTADTANTVAPMPAWPTSGPARPRWLLGSNLAEEARKEIAAETAGKCPFSHGDSNVVSIADHREDAGEQEETDR
ncbi:hypothetical protein GGD81_003440 [Rhodobium orientis]|uniref:Uncharacterized protein n=1 Tax=Rhodobium orientis TaxID=34017 RepID=A0A327JJ78_9HYPH|nr:hypothetical protein [Rhodobium orientis]MBB4304381.1 hypothetical protein [Rhodobium orientis]MBK5951987.1 hypothetical protein [Rhodobium orientis]RAI25766.1 hypothetical protein CH339_16800 [Rhodobium orientis]